MDFRMNIKNPNRRRLLVCGLGALLLAVWAGGRELAAQPRSAGAENTREFRPRRVLGPQPAITNPPVLRADQVRDQVTDNELVVGVVVGGEARAYPINMLTGPRREIINDTLGGVPIAATW
jgi:hypothetical protein